MDRCAKLFCLFVFGLSAAGAQAQEGSRFPQPAEGQFRAYHHASTLAEGVLRGRADLIRGIGEYNYNTASAALIFEEARKARYDNELKHAETFWTKRQIYASAVAAEKAQRASRHAPAKVEHRAVAFAAPQVRIDPSRPGFAWPTVLLRPEFENFRGQLVALFQLRNPFEVGTADADQVVIRNTVSEMRLALGLLVRETQPLDYIEARQFLDRLLQESRLPAGMNVAARD